MKRRLEVLFQSGLQLDSTMEGKWFVPDPCVVGGRLTVSGLGWWAEDRPEWGETLWGGGAPSTLAEPVKAEQEKSSAAESRSDRSKSGFLIFFLVRAAQTADAADCGASTPPSYRRRREGKMKWGSPAKVEWLPARRGVISRAASGVKERQHFDSLSSGGGGKKGINIVEIGWASVLKINVIAVVCPGHMWFPWTDLAPKPEPKSGKTAWMSFPNKWPVFLQPHIF